MRGVHCVVVNYRTPDDLAEFLDSWDAYVMDNASLVVVNVDPTPEDRLVAARFPVVLNIQENVGYGRACNLGARTGNTGDVLAFFNADTVLTQGVVDMCYGALRAQSDWGVLGPRQVDEKNRITHGGICGSHEQPSLRGWLSEDRGQFSDVDAEVVSVSGSAYFIKRSVWDQLWTCPTYQEFCEKFDLPCEGAFLPTRHYYEETWASYHAAAHGWKVVYFGPARMIHKWHRASPVGGWADQQQRASQKLFREACDVHGIPRD